MKASDKQMVRAAVPTRAGVSAALRRMSRRVGEFNAARYFRGDHGLRFYNVGTSAMRALASDIWRAQRNAWSVEDAMLFADALMRDPYLETKSVGIEVVARYRRRFSPKLLPRWKSWLATNLSANWATTDAICGMLIGPLLADRPELVPKMRAWARHRNLWVRRASIVSLIVPMRRGLALDAAYDNARELHRDPPDLIQKAVGWALREAGKQDAARLEAYLRANGPAIPRTTLRYAIERFSPAKRRELLAATRSRG
jgi:3-methyladenine DNA glycosylase AlkD